MLYLSQNTANQTLITTAQELNRYTDAFTDYLLVFGMDLANDDTIYKLIPTVAETNDRYTKFTVSTNADDPTAGSVLIPTTISGKFHYRIYGQNSSTNLDPTNAAVVRLLEQGYLSVSSSTDYFDEKGGTLPTFMTYGGQ